MIQLLIVDDEAHWVDNLADHKPWEQLGVDVVHKAYSAFEALELMNTYPIDIVITDIRMPELSGLELIDEIRKRKPDAVCVLLTGHSEFDYAKQAVSLQAFDYLLKPVKDEELFRVVDKAVGRLARHGEELRQRQRMSYSLRESLPLIRSSLLREQLRGTGGGRTWEEKASRYGIPFHEGDKCLLLLIRMERDFGPSALEAPQEDRNWVEFSVLNITEEWFCPYMDVWGCREEHGYIVLLLKPRADAPNAGDGRPVLEQLSLGLQQKIKLYVKETASLLLTEELAFPQEVRGAYEQALSSFRQHVGGRQELILLEGEPARRAAKSLQTLEAMPTLLQLLEVNQWELAERKAEHLFEELNGLWRESFEHLLVAGMELCSAFVKLAHKNGTFLGELAAKPLNDFAEGKPLHSIQALQAWTRHMFELLRETHAEEMNVSRKAVIRRVQEYIDKHLKNGASLRAIADHVHMHPTHLSKIYKLETGQGLSDYMINLRMEKASDLLLRSDLRIYEICEEIGYLDPAYFIKVFRKYYGMTPQEYRDRKQNNKLL